MDFRRRLLEVIDKEAASNDLVEYIAGMTEDEVDYLLKIGFIGRADEDVLSKLVVTVRDYWENIR
jgi:hypothetical protein